MSACSFIEATTVSIAGTGGNGAVTMQQITGLPDFVKAYGTTATRAVDYVIEDTANLYYESGQGTVTNGVLTRNVIYETWNGTTFQNVGASPLAFGSTPAAGNIRVRMAPRPDLAWKPPSALQLLSTRWGGYTCSAHIAGSNSGNNIGLALNTEYYFPFLNPIRGAVAGMAIVVNVVGAGGAQAKMGIYEVGPDGLPGPCIAQSAAIAVTSLGVQADATPAAWTVNVGPLKLTHEFYFIGLMTNDTTVRFLGMPPGGGMYTFTPLGQVSGYGWGQLVFKTAQNTFAVGLPTGTPSGSYSVSGSGAGAASNILPLLKIANS